jgi:diacylglycerol kinase (ATP)
VGVTGLGDTRWSDNIRPDDGQTDICIIRARTARDYLALLWALLRYQQPRLPKVTCLQAKKEISIVANTPIPVRLHGHCIDQTTLKVRVIPRALNVVVPEI